MWWMWTKRVLYLAASVWLLIGAFTRLYYFHYEMEYGDPKLLNPSYSDQIQVESYLMSQQNLIDLFEGLPPNPDKRSLTENETWEELKKPSSPRFYLVLRLKNQGDQIAWGSLDFVVNGKKTRQIDVPPLGPNMSNYEIMALRAGQHDKCQFEIERSYPNLNTKWSLLYTKEEAYHE